MRHIITIAGNLGSGKSTAARGVAKALNYPHYSGGDFMRALATDRGMNLIELGALAETDESIDILIDKRQKEFIDANDNFVIDSRLGWHWAPDSFKVFLSIDDETAAARILSDKDSGNPFRKSEEGLTTKEDVIKEIKHRRANEGARYLKYYGIKDHLERSNFDLVIDTRESKAEEVINKIVEAYQKWQSK
jgi:CMP/dCMP kinase